MNRLEAAEYRVLPHAVAALLLGQFPDTLEDVWVHLALGKVEKARQTIDAVPERHPFDLGYREVERVAWGVVRLDDDARRRTLARGWAERPVAGGSA